MTSMFNHRQMALNPQYGLTGFFSFTYFFIYEMMSCVFDSLGIIIIVLAFFAGFLDMTFFLTFMLIYVFYNTGLSIMAIKFEEYMFRESLSLRARIKLILFSLIENFGYRQLISLYRFSALIGYRKHKHQWKKISRVKHNKLH